jgi:succinoglycan biosynthesis transport protein ExoP
MTFRQFLSILLARRWLPLWPCLLGVLVPAVLISLLLPKRYTAEASLGGRWPPDPLGGSTFQSMMTFGLVHRHAGRHHQQRARRAPRGAQLRLTENPQVRARVPVAGRNGKGSIEVWLVDQFPEQLDVKPLARIQRHHHQLLGARPGLCRRLANAYPGLSRHRARAAVDPAKQYSTFFEQRVKEARDTLEAAQAKLSAFQRENGVVATDERMDVETQRLNELSSQLVQLQAMSPTRPAASPGQLAPRATAWPRC